MSGLDTSLSKTRCNASDFLNGPPYQLPVLRFEERIVFWGDALFA